MRLDESPFYYAVNNSAQVVRTISRDIFPAEAYEVEGVFKLPALSRDRERTVFTKVPSMPLAMREAANYTTLRTHGKGDEGNGQILMHDEAYRALQSGIELSTKVENGGYLLGVPFRQPSSALAEDEADFRWLLEVTDAVPAEAAWGKRGSLLFTGETWSRMTRLRDREHPDKKLVGWFHTHLFKASENFGLSGLDQDLHRRFLTKAWQIAVLININAEGQRIVRSFQRGAEGDLVECPFQLIESANSGKESQHE
jgi:hypothetical protein